MEPPAALGGLVILAPSAQGGRPPARRTPCSAPSAPRPALRRAAGDGGSLFVTVSRLDGAFGFGDLDPRREPLDGGLAGLAKTAG